MTHTVLLSIQMILHIKGRKICQIRKIFLPQIYHYPSVSNWKASMIAQPMKSIYSLVKSSVHVVALNSDDFFMWLIRIPRSCYNLFNCGFLSPQRTQHCEV